MRHIIRAVCCGGAAVGLVAWACASRAASVESDRAARFLAEVGLRGGLVVHLGCGDGALAAAVRAGGAFLVHGLDADAANVEAARARIRSLDLEGAVSVERWTSPRLPYADNLVNLLVADDGGRTPETELLRVLAPGGVAVAGGRKILKPRVPDTDEWTHFLHGADGNAVARDRVVGPPRRLQWEDAPRYARSHEHTPSIAALVSSGGRIVYIVDEAPAASILEPPRWQIVARDAYNGLLLWKRPVPVWWPHLCGWTRGPRQLQRKLVAAGDRVYAAAGLFAPLSELDAATGRTLRVFEGTDGVEELVLDGGVLLLAVRAPTAERIAERQTWERLSARPKSPLHDRDTAAPFIDRLRAADQSAPTSVVALDVRTGRELWRRPGVKDLKPLTLATAGGRAFYQDGREIVCLDLVGGARRWSAAGRPLRLVCGRGVVCAGDDAIELRSADTGAAVWTGDTLLCETKDVFVIGGSVWAGGFKPWRGQTSGKRGPAWGPYFATEFDLGTGRRLRHIEPENPGHHHRCYPNKATDRFILGGRRGTEFIDLQTGEVVWNSWARGVCMYGIMPCNGLLYLPPHACGCYTTVKTIGFCALAAAAAPRPAAGGDDADSFERGPAFGGAAVADAAAAADWPTYRGDAERSGRTAAVVPAKLQPLWRTAVGGAATPPTVAGGRVFVAVPDAHRLCALDGDTGRIAWDVVAGGRIDTPPTIHRGRVLFGSRDGCVYSARVSDGALAWRRRLAREDRRVVVRGRLESVSPVHGSVLLAGGAVWAAAGRSSYLDGGIDLCRIDPDTGALLSRTTVHSPDPDTGKQPDQYSPNAMPGAREDILVCDGQTVYLRDLAFDMAGRPSTNARPHLLTLTSFLDDDWAHRAYWVFGTRCSLSTGCSQREKDLVYGRLLALDGGTVYGYGRQTVHWSNQLLDGAYRVFAVGRSGGAQTWSKSVPIQVRALAVAGGVLFVAGTGPDDGALVMSLSTADGTEVSRCGLPGRPVFDGLAAAGGRLYAALEGGEVVCLAPQPAATR